MSFGPQMENLDDFMKGHQIKLAKNSRQDKTEPDKRNFVFNIHLPPGVIIFLNTCTLRLNREKNHSTEKLLVSYQTILSNRSV